MRMIRRRWEFTLAWWYETTLSLPRDGSLCKDRPVGWSATKGFYIEIG
jgi:hypothetical protein